MRMSSHSSPQPDLLNRGDSHRKTACLACLACPWRKSKAGTVTGFQRMKGGIALGSGPSGTDFPTVVNRSWPDDRTLNVTLSLEPSHQYGFSVLGALFATKDGHDAGETTEIAFTTGE